jgi:hypothetical protein
MSQTAEKRVFSLILQRKRYDADIVERYIMYRGDKLILDDAACAELFALIPEVWNSDRDRLVQFVLFEDSTYLCVRNKDIYNYQLKESEEKTYFYNAATERQVADLVKIVETFFGKKKLEEVDNFYNDIMTSLSDMSYVKEKILQMREEALYRTDYMFNKDYTFSDAELEEKYKTYRQEWRDITKTDAWVNTDLMNLSLPLSPKPNDTAKLALEGLQYNIQNLQITDQLVKDMELTMDCSAYETTAKKFGEVAFKLEVLKTMSKLRIPITNNPNPDDTIDQIQTLDANLSAANIIPQDIYNRYLGIRQVEGEDSDTSMKELAEEQIFNLDAKIDAINEKLQEYNVDFTIGDIITKFVENTKALIEDAESEKEAERLIADIEGAE